MLPVVQNWRLYKWKDREVQDPPQSGRFAGIVSTLFRQRTESAAVRGRVSSVLLRDGLQSLQNSATRVPVETQVSELFTVRSSARADGKKQRSRTKSALKVGGRRIAKTANEQALERDS